MPREQHIPTLCATTRAQFEVPVKDSVQEWAQVLNIGGR